MTPLNLTTLGSAPAAPHPYLAGLSMAPVPKHPSLRRLPPRNHQPATNAPTDKARQLADADIRGMIGALTQLDHFARRLQDHCPMKYDMKRKLSLLVNHSDNLLAEVFKEFGTSEADEVNAWGNLLGQSAGLVLQLTPPQVKAAFTHMNNMAESVLAYVPPTLPAACIEHEPNFR